MTDAQLATIVISALGVIGVGIRWLVLRSEAQREADRRAQSEAAERLARSQDRATEALVANTASNAVLIAKMDQLGDKIDGISDFVSEHTPVGPIPKMRATAVTPRSGVRVPRPGTYRDKDR